MEMNLVNFLFMSTDPDLKRLIEDANMEQAEFAGAIRESPQTVQNWIKRGVPLVKRPIVGEALKYEPWMTPKAPKAEINIKHLTLVLEAIEDLLPSIYRSHVPASVRAKALAGTYRLWPEGAQLPWAEIRAFIRPIKDKYGGMHGNKRSAKSGNPRRPKGS